MRPVNLIPKEERPGGRRPLREGPLAYIVVGALALAVIGVTALVVTNTKVSERQTEVTQLQSKEATLQAKAGALASYTQFSAVRKQRVATVDELADSRFDWHRVLDELGLLMTNNVQVTSLNGSVAPEASSGTISLRGEIAGPALEMSGCADSQAGVADFIETVKEVEGVTRVAVPSSTSGGAGANAGTASCPAGTTEFQLVAGFDAAPVSPLASGGEEVAPEATTEVAPESESTSTEPEATSTETASTGSTEGSPAD
jgi:Tfp pilus assembly protein PilN